MTDFCLLIADTYQQSTKLFCVIPFLHGLLHNISLLAFYLFLSFSISFVLIRSLSFVLFILLILSSTPGLAGFMCMIQLQREKERKMEGNAELLALQRLDETSAQLQKQGNYLEALECMERGLVLRQHFFGADSDEVWSACKTVGEMCNLLAMTYLQQEDFNMVRLLIF